MCLIQLKGGIQTYVRDVREEGMPCYFKGNLYVFDRRQVSQSTQQKKNEMISGGGWKKKKNQKQKVDQNNIITLLIDFFLIDSLFSIHPLSLCQFLFDFYFLL